MDTKVLDFIYNRDLEQVNGQDKMSMRFITTKCLNSILNSIEIDWKLCEITGADIFVSRTAVALNEG